MMFTKNLQSPALDRKVSFISRKHCFILRFRHNWTIFLLDKRWFSVYYIDNILQHNGIVVRAVAPKFLRAA